MLSVGVKQKSSHRVKKYVNRAMVVRAAGLIGRGNVPRGQKMIAIRVAWRYNGGMQHGTEHRMTRRAFLKGLGALALTALPACRRAQQYAIAPEDCPEWQLPGQATAFATSMPWPCGALPLLAVCHDGLPTMLQPNPHYADVRPGLPAFAQAALTDLYSPHRPGGATFNGKPYPERALQGAWRAWCKALREGRRMACLFPAGYSPVRAEQVAELRQFGGASFYEYDPVAAPRDNTFPALDELIEATLAPAVRFDSGFGTLAGLTAVLPELELLLIFTPADPAALNADFAAALRQTAAETVRFCPPGPPAPDYTAELCRYTVPLTHFLEEWGAEADAAGNLCLRQPVSHPLRPSVSETEALHALLREEALPLSERPEISPAREWLLRAVPHAERILSRGVEPGSAPQAQPLARRAVVGSAHYLHPFYADGRFSHNPWLRETRFPLTGYVGVAETFVPDHDTAAAPAICTVPGLEYICYPVGSQPAPTALPPRRGSKPLPELRYSSPPQCGRSDTPQWALTIDITRCDGCSACVLACRAENNIPIVGAEELTRDRDLQWLRVDRYLNEDGRAYYLPMACRQCELAPCEAVCPVHATVHTDEGLNAMVYPRCWGTRYCAAACPYGARHFNYRDYSTAARATTGTPANPQVSLRPSGVMEKCTYCVQRLNAARRDGSTPQTACQQACPRGAIRLIDLRHEVPEKVIVSFDSPATRPRTLYL